MFTYILTKYATRNVCIWQTFLLYENRTHERQCYTNTVCCQMAYKLIKRNLSMFILRTSKTIEKSSLIIHTGKCAASVCKRSGLFVQLCCSTICVHSPFTAADTETFATPLFFVSGNRSWFSLNNYTHSHYRCH